MLESSAIIRELETPHVLGFNKDEKHHTTSLTCAKLPAWDALWPETEKIIRSELADVVR